MVFTAQTYLWILDQTVCALMLNYCQLQSFSAHNANQRKQDRFQGMEHASAQSFVGVLTDIAPRSDGSLQMYTFSQQLRHTLISLICA